MECLRLRINDVDLKRRLVIVRSGKGDKDQGRVNPEPLKDDLIQHMDSVREIYESEMYSSHEALCPFLHSLLPCPSDLEPICICLEAIKCPLDCHSVLDASRCHGR